MNRTLHFRFFTALFTIAAAMLLMKPSTSSAQNLYVSNLGGDVQEFNAVTAAKISGTFGGTISNQTTALAISGNVVYIASGAGIGEYNATTGSLINGSFTSVNANNGPDDPDMMVLSNNTLYVAHGNTVGAYDATTGNTISSSFLSFVTTSIFGMVVSGNDLYVGEGNGISEFDGTTGNLLSNTLINLTGQGTVYSMALSGTDIYVGFGSESIAEYNAVTGATVSGTLTTLAHPPLAMAVSGTDLFVTTGVDTVGEFNAITGGTINASFISGVGQSNAIIVSPVPEPGAWATVFLTLGTLACAQYFRRRSESRVSRDNS